MKKYFAYLLSLVLLFSFASFPVSADDADEPIVYRGSKTVTTGYDNNYNRFTVKGNTAAGISYGYARTYYSIKNYGSGLKSSMYYVTCFFSVDTTVSFSDGTVQNTTTLSGSSYAISGHTDATIVESAQIVKSYSSFAGAVAQVLCLHAFHDDAGGNATASFFTSASTT